MYCVHVGVLIGVVFGCPDYYDCERLKGSNVIG